ncbi:unnamed protein product [Bursaphelenchus okinawaensis]|uniref:POU domain protein n=1 Tax=Bursaphelenchus okinawaensis TaxID=465554 RepID=A0A811LPS3_9BILA|nr:unnamed protein product [Bursaphelenchus okinawaensis]CAG9125162.1 unnamed protein product [Bursaphelenchus okinawaensis]
MTAVLARDSRHNQSFESDESDRQSVDDPMASDLHPDEEGDHILRDDIVENGAKRRSVADHVLVNGERVVVVDPNVSDVEEEMDEDSDRPASSTKRSVSPQLLAKRRKVEQPVKRPAATEAQFSPVKKMGRNASMASLNDSGVVSGDDSGSANVSVPANLLKLLLAAAAGDDSVAFTDVLKQCPELIESFNEYLPSCSKQTPKVKEENEDTTTTIDPNTLAKLSALSSAEQITTALALWPNATIGDLANRAFALGQEPSTATKKASMKLSKAEDQDFDDQGTTNWLELFKNEKPQQITITRTPARAVSARAREPSGHHMKSSESVLSQLRAQKAEVNPELAELEQFAQHFKRQRIKHGFTQGDVGIALGRRYGTDFSQTTISRFEALNLSFKNMCKLRPLMEEWMNEAEAAIERGASVTEIMEAESLASPSAETIDDDAAKLKALLEQSVDSSQVRVFNNVKSRESDRVYNDKSDRIYVEHPNNFYVNYGVVPFIVKPLSEKSANINRSQTTNIEKGKLGKDSEGRVHNSMYMYKVTPFEFARDSSTAYKNRVPTLSSSSPRRTQPVPYRDRNNLKMADMTCFPVHKPTYPESSTLERAKSTSSLRLIAHDHSNDNIHYEHIKRLLRRAEARLNDMNLEKKQRKKVEKFLKSVNELPYIDCDALPVVKEVLYELNAKLVGEPAVYSPIMRDYKKDNVIDRLLTWLRNHLFFKEKGTKFDGVRRKDSDIAENKWKKNSKHSDDSVEVAKRAQQLLTQMVPPKRVEDIENKLPEYHKNYSEDELVDEEDYDLVEEDEDGALQTLDNDVFKNHFNSTHWNGQERPVQVDLGYDDSFKTFWNNDWWNNNQYNYGMPWQDQSNFFCSVALQTQQDDYDAFDNDWNQSEWNSIERTQALGWAEDVAEDVHDLFFVDFSPDRCSPILQGAVQTAFGNMLPALKKRRKRTNLDTRQKDALDNYFLENPRPDHGKMAEIGCELDLDPDVVRVWFCNRRQKLRKVV